VIESELGYVHRETLGLEVLLQKLSLGSSFVDTEDDEDDEYDEDEHEDKMR